MFKSQNGRRGDIRTVTFYQPLNPVICKSGLPLNGSGLVATYAHRKRRYFGVSGWLNQFYVLVLVSNMTYQKLRMRRLHLDMSLSTFLSHPRSMQDGLLDGSASGIVNRFQNSQN